MSNGQEYRSKPIVVTLQQLKSLAEQASFYDQHYQNLLDTESEKTRDDPGLDDLQEKLDDAHYKISNDKSRVEKLINYFSREQKKIPFFGDVSNGKSATLNAMLHDEVLPSRTGHTTDALLSISGHQKDSYDIIEGSKVDSVRDIGMLHTKLRLEAGEGGERTFGTVPLVQIKIPVDKHPFIGTNTTLYDCPGANNTLVFDSALASHCEDADVIVVVVDAARRVSMSEKNFLCSVKERVAAPELFFLANKWDTVPEAERDRNIRSFTRDIKKFLQEKLRLDLPEGRIHCVAAKKVLEARRQGTTNEYTDSFEAFQEALEVFINERKENLARKHKEQALESARSIEEAMKDMTDVAGDLTRRSEREMKEKQQNRFEPQVQKVLNRICEDFAVQLDRKYLEEVIGIKDKILNATRNQMATKEFANSLKEDIQTGLERRLTAWMDDAHRKYQKECKAELTDILSANLTEEEEKTFHIEAGDQAKIEQVSLTVEKIGRFNFDGKAYDQLRAALCKTIFNTISTLADSFLLATFEKYAGRIKAVAAVAKGVGAVGGMTSELKEKQDEQSAMQALKEEFQKEIEHSMQVQKSTNIPKAKEDLEMQLKKLHNIMVTIRQDVIQNTLDSTLHGMNATRDSMNNTEKQLHDLLENLNRLIL